MRLRYTSPAPFHQAEPLGEIPDPDIDVCSEGTVLLDQQIIHQTSKTRRVIRSHSIPDNASDPKSTIKLTLLAQRRGDGAAQRGDAWTDIDGFTLSKLYANEHAKMEFGPTQTKRLFLHVARRYLEQGCLSAILTDLGVSAVVTEGPAEVSKDVIQDLVRHLTLGGKADLWLEIIKGLEADPDLVESLGEIASCNPDAAQVAAASMNLATYSLALEELDSLIDDCALENKFQSLLENHPWMFGGEYSARVDRRRFTRDENADFMMRRTVDNYLELIEIKRPINKELFQYDRSHDSYFPSTELSQVLGQVVKYLDEIDASRDSIERRGRRNEEKTNKLRAKIIIGRDNDDEQVDVLRQFNSHLHRIEVLTFDQLQRTALRVKTHLTQVLQPVVEPTAAEDSEVPF